MMSYYYYVGRLAHSHNMMDEGASSPGSPGTAESTTRQYKMISIGICAMNKKTLAPPMQNILYRLKQQDYVRFIYFTDEMILNDPIEEWPTCDCVIAFYSKGFPLEKTINYVKLRSPFVINDLQMQYALQDRRQVYEILAQNGIEVPRYMILNRPEKTSSSPSDEELIEADDQVEIGGQVFHKPFVEKPISAEDHNIYIYFPSDYGGGSQRLFRKVKDRSSEYSKESSVRKKGSYIYEEFMATDGTDVKVYTVGPDYAHAEARKSPALDGKVERDEQGKEKRFPVILTAKEKLIARQVCLAFKQTVCGFDLLRANGKSYVCDVNGFSFVKNSQKYYEDCAQILLEMITEQFAPEYFPLIPPSVEYLAEEVPVPIPKTGNQLELRCVIGVIRHGDRTPKQKMKMIVKHKKFFDLFADLNGYKTGHLKIKKPKQLQKVLDIARYLLDNVEKYHESHEIGEKVHKLQQLKSVLEMYGYFSGINRKVQFKLLKEAKGGPLLLLILKWGGELTPAGQRQAEELGRAFRCMYPGGQGEYASLPGSGFLRLHSTYRHDLKVYASDEGRVQMTAAAFTKGLLDLEGNLASVLVHLVKRDQNATNMLDTSTGAQDALLKVKMRLHEFLRSHEVVTEQQALENLAPTMVESLVSALKHIKNPREACEQLYQSVQALTKEIKKIVASGAEVELYHEETPQMMHNRWAKLEKDFKMKDGRFDISKIPDIYDCIKYDLVHNRHLGLKKALQTFQQAMHLADVVIPQEYGITVAEKMDIATKICSPLLRKIQADLHHTIMEEHSDIIHRLDAKLSRGVITPNRHVRSRLYFTSESHIHSMLNILRYGGLVENPEDPSWRHTMEKVGRFSELNYMTQIVIMLFEDDSEPYDSDTRYRVDVHFSPGVKGSEEMAKWSCKEHPTPTLKLSPDMVSKSSSMWVKRLIVDDGVPRQLGTEPIHIHVPHHYLPKSSSAMTRKASEPATYNLKSASEGQLTRRRRGFSLTLATGGCDQVTDGLQSSSTSILDLGEGTGILEETPSEKTILGDERQDVSLSPTKTEQKKLHLKSGVSAFAEDSQHSLVEGGLELAAELSSTLEPLILLCSTPLLKMNTFLTQQTGVTLDY